MEMRAGNFIEKVVRISPAESKGCRRWGTPVTQLTTSETLNTISRNEKQPWSRDPVSESAADSIGGAKATQDGFSLVTRLPQIAQSDGKLSVTVFS
jgi:hypothetical protein